MTQEALKLALEALGAYMSATDSEEDLKAHSLMAEAFFKIKEALAQEKALQALHNENERLGLYKDAYAEQETVGYWKEHAQGMQRDYDSLLADYEKLAQPEQEPVAWKLVPINPTNEMLKAMDECSTEGYDERLLAGHAASVYMAAVDVAPTPPQRQEQEPVVWMYQDKSTHEVRFQKHMRGFVDHGATYETPLYTTPPQLEERNYCPRCGKRTKDIHTCTPPQD